MIDEQAKPFKPKTLKDHGLLSKTTALELAAN